MHVRRVFAPDQCRSGRALIGISVRVLCHVAGIRPATVEAYEGGFGTLEPWEREALGNAFHELGVIAVPATAWAGGGVRLRRPPMQSSLSLEQNNPERDLSERQE